MMYTLDFNNLKVNLGVFFFQQKNGASNIIATAQMKFASEARPSQYIVPFCNTEPTCMPQAGHFMDIEGHQLSPTYNASW